MQSVIGDRSLRVLLALLLGLSLMLVAVSPAFAQTADDPAVEDPADDPAEDAEEPDEEAEEPEEEAEEPEEEEPRDIEDFVIDDEVIERLLTTGLVQGHDLGNGEVDYDLDGLITRAQLVTVLVRAFNGEEEARNYEGDPAFPDTGDDWWHGYIAVATELAHEPMGYPDGTFAPSRNVTVAEAIAFAMKFLGISPVEGEWPANYIHGLAEAGIISEAQANGLELVANESAERGLVFALLGTIFATYEVEDGKTVYDLLDEAAAAADADDEEADDEADEEEDDEEEEDEEDDDADAEEDEGDGDA